MSLRSSGPRRSESVESYLRQTRAGAALALLALAGAIASEQFAEHLWVRHPLLAGLASSAIVVMLSVAVLNEALEIRSRRRWSVLAQYVMLELVRDARMVWTAVVELADLMAADARAPASSRGTRSPVSPSSTTSGTPPSMRYGCKNPSRSAVKRMARAIKFWSGSLGNSAVPCTPRPRTRARPPGLERTVARTLKYISSASPRQSNPAPIFAVEAGTRTSNELCRAEVI